MGGNGQWRQCFSFCDPVFQFGHGSIVFKSMSEDVVWKLYGFPSLHGDAQLIGYEEESADEKRNTRIIFGRELFLSFLLKSFRTLNMIEVTARAAQASTVMSRPHFLQWGSSMQPLYFEQWSGILWETHSLLRISMNRLINHLIFNISEFNETYTPTSGVRSICNWDQTLPETVVTVKKHNRCIELKIKNHWGVSCVSTSESVNDPLIWFDWTEPISQTTLCKNSILAFESWRKSDLLHWFYRFDEGARNVEEETVIYFFPSDTGATTKRPLRTMNSSIDRCSSYHSRSERVHCEFFNQIRTYAVMLGRMQKDSIDLRREPSVLQN